MHTKLFIRETKEKKLYIKGQLEAEEVVDTSY